METYDDVGSLVLLMLKVQIMRQRMVPALVRPRKHDRHVEFTPALLLDLEGRLLERCLQLANVLMPSSPSSLPLPSSPLLQTNGTQDSIRTLLILLKARVQIIHRLLEAIGHDLVPLVVHEPDLDAPAAHGETLHRGRLRDGALPRDELDGALDLLGGLAGVGMGEAWGRHGGR